MGYEPNDLTIKPADNGIVCLTQPCSTLSDGVKHWLKVSWRAGDYAQNLARSSLLRQCFSQVMVTLLQLLKQPHVLNGDHGLIGKGFKELDLRWGEGTHFDPTCGQGSNEFPLLAKGND